MKKCTKCQNTKSLEQFPNHKKTLDKKGSWCKECVGSLRKADYQKHKISRDAKTRKWQRENPERVRGYRIASTFKISDEEYQAMFKAQNGLCSICLKSEVSKMLSIDHNHNTGSIRGLLCQSCNLAIGLLKDNPESLKRAIDYLDKVR